MDHFDGDDRRRRPGDSETWTMGTFRAAPPRHGAARPPRPSYRELKTEERIDGRRLKITPTRDALLVRPGLAVDGRATLLGKANTPKPNTPPRTLVASAPRERKSTTFARETAGRTRVEPAQVKPAREAR